jgi:hypothetical protein
MKWWQSRKLPGRGGRVRGLLSPSWSKSDRDRREVIGKLVILASEGIGKIYVSMGTRITSIDDLIRKATPWGAGDSQRDGNSSASTGSFHKKNALIISAISTPRYAVGTVPG